MIHYKQVSSLTCLLSSSSSSSLGCLHACGLTVGDSSANVDPQVQKWLEEEKEGSLVTYNWSCEVEVSVEGDCLLECYIVYCGRNSPLSQRCILPPSSPTLMMEAVSNSKTSVSFYQSTQCNIPRQSFSCLLPWGPEIPLRFLFLHSLTYLHENKVSRKVWWSLISGSF
jgi:hypothetical protein